MRGRAVLTALVRAGLTTAVIDGLFSSVLSAGFYGSTVTRLWQGVASTLLGADAFSGGTRTMLVGLLMHVGVAFTWSGVFLLVFLAAPWLRRVVSSPYGWLAVAAVYGPFIWSAMSLVVIPALLHRPPTIRFRWWVQFVGHVPFVALPIIWSIRRTLSVNHGADVAPGAALPG
jgi:hypothetical protein